MPTMGAQATDRIPSREAAALLGVHPDTLKRWVEAGRLTCWRTPGGHRRYSRAEIASLLVSTTKAA